MIEAAGEGNDRIEASVSFTLSAGQEIETLTTADQAGTAAINLTGNALGAGDLRQCRREHADRRRRGRLPARLRRRRHPDRQCRRGLDAAGRDRQRLVLRLPTGDSLIEFAGEGNDRILTSVGYTLVGRPGDRERWPRPIRRATAAIDLTGNALAQIDLRQCRREHADRRRRRGLPARPRRQRHPVRQCRRGLDAAGRDRRRLVLRLPDRRQHDRGRRRGQRPDPDQRQLHALGRPGDRDAERGRYPAAMPRSTLPATASPSSSRAPTAPTSWPATAARTTLPGAAAPTSCSAATATTC